jgi:hypothetical protein
VALLFWDASALSKRYTLEMGYQTVDALFTYRASHTLAATAWGYAETYSILLRRYNGGILDLLTFTAAISLLQAEVVYSPDFGLMSIGDTTVFASIATMRAHNLNATDAAILTLLLEYTAALPPGSPSVVLIASDQRLLRAAQAEGLQALNPETLPPQMF